MPITHTHRKGITYILCQGQTKTDKPRYTFVREPQGIPLDELPAGYKICGLKNYLSTPGKSDLRKYEKVYRMTYNVVAHPRRPTHCIFC